jgi:hypothetical protein
VYGHLAWVSGHSSMDETQMILLIVVMVVTVLGFGGLLLAMFS